METIVIIKIIFWALAIIVSISYGLCARYIFLDNPLNEKPFSWKVHQFWFNFIGSIIGWCLIWLIIPKIYLSISSEESITYNYTDVLILIFGFIGVTGHLPLTIFSIINNIKDLLEKVFGGKPNNN